MPAFGPAVRAIASILVLAMLPSICRAADDWLDDMPNVSRVVEAVREQLAPSLQRQGASGVNPEYLAEYVAGTLIGLRGLMQMHVAKNGPPTAQSAARIRALANDYMQVELAIGQALRSSKAHKEMCERSGTYLNRGGKKMFASTAECVSFRIHNTLEGVFPSYEYRKSLFPRLFCNRWDVHLNLMQEIQVRIPSPVKAPEPSPADTLSMPGGVAALGPALCKFHGGDTNGNGLCDDWEKPISQSFIPAANAAWYLRPGSAQGTSSPSTSGGVCPVFVSKAPQPANMTPGVVNPAPPCQYELLHLPLRDQ